MTAYRDKHTKNINRMFGQNAEICNVTEGRRVYGVIKEVKSRNLCYRRHVLAGE
jgi:hypothetical protein